MSAEILKRVKDRMIIGTVYSILSGQHNISWNPEHETMQIGDRLIAEKVPAENAIAWAVERYQAPDWMLELYPWAIGK